jgi:hypothetical protein
MCAFGLSTSITERVGQKTLTYYCGTPGFMSYEMTKLKHSQYEGCVDLFYNDVYGLSKVIDFAMTSIYDQSYRLNIMNDVPYRIYSSNETPVS